jgi:heat shock protein HslJ
MMRKTTLLLLGLALLLAGCGGAGSGAGEGTGSPDGDWVLVDGTGPDGAIPIVEGSPPALSIDGDEWGGSICNHYGSTVRRDGDQVTIGDVARTEMACLDEGLMASEDAYLAAYVQVERFALDGAQLRLAGPDLELRYDPVAPEPDAALEGTAWRLDALVEGADPDSAVSSVLGDATLELESGQLGGHSGCNGFGGGYEVDGNRLLVGDIESTLIGCDEALAAQEAHIVGVLQADPTFRIEGASLELTDDDGHGLIYRAD